MKKITIKYQHVFALNRKWTINDRSSARLTCRGYTCTIARKFKEQ